MGFALICSDEVKGAYDLHGFATSSSSGATIPFAHRVITPGSPSPTYSGATNMNTSTLTRSREFSQAAEHQMRTWALRMELQARLEKQRAAMPPKQLIYPYIAISRESGVDAGEIAKLVGAKCGWKVLDRGFLDYMAEQYHWSRIALEYVDERTASWFHDTFGKWLDEKAVSQPEYVSRLGRIVLMAAQHESTVFVGRGAQFILPRDLGLSVRVIDLKQQRIERIVKRLELSPERPKSLSTRPTKAGRISSGATSIATWLIHTSTIAYSIWSIPLARRPRS